MTTKFLIILVKISCVWSVFYLLLVARCSLPLDFWSLIVSGCRSLCVPSGWNWLWFLNMYIHIFHHFGKFPSIISSNNLSSTNYLLFLEKKMFVVPLDSAHKSPIFCVCLFICTCCFYQRSKWEANLSSYQNFSYLVLFLGASMITS